MVARIVISFAASKTPSKPEVLWMKPVARWAGEKKFQIGLIAENC
jgi:hypothetical protein